MRRALLPLLFALSACSPGAEGPAGAKAPAAASAPPQPGSPVEALREHLARLPDLGPPLEGLSAACRADVGALAASLPEAERKVLAHGSTSALERHPLLALSAAEPPDEALYLVGCRGGASRDLVAARQTARAGGPTDDLPGCVRASARRSASLFARRLSSPARLLSLPDLDRLDEAGRTLGDARLRRLAREAAASADRSGQRLASAAAGAAQDRDPKAARRFLEEARSASAPAAPSSLLDEARRAIEASEALEGLEGLEASTAGGARGEAGLEAARQALLLGRVDLIASLLERAAIAPPSRLDASVLSALASLEGSVCGSLEASLEPADLCPLAFRTSPEVKASLSLLERGWASGAGRSGWAIEAYVGLHDVLPMTFGAPGETALTEREAAERSRRHLAHVVQALSDPGAPPAPRGPALRLFAELVLATSGESGEAGAMDPARQQAVEREALSLVKAHPLDGLARRAAIASAVALSPYRDASALLEAVPAEGEGAADRAAAAVVLGERHRRPSLSAEGRAGLEHLPPSVPAPARARARLLAAEGGVLADGSTEALSALAAEASSPAAGLPLVETLRRAIDRAGALSRLGKADEAEAGFVKAVGLLESGAGGSEARELLSLFEAEGLALLAASPDAKARGKAEAKLGEKLSSPSRSSPEAQLYRSLWLFHLGREQQRSCRDEACRSEARSALERAGRAEESARKSLSPEVAGWVERGVIPSGTTFRFALTYGPQAGLGASVELLPRLVVMTPPPGPAAPVSPGRARTAPTPPAATRGSPRR